MRSFRTTTDWAFVLGNRPAMKAPPKQLAKVKSNLVRDGLMTRREIEDAQFEVGKQQLRRELWKKQKGLCFYCGLVTKINGSNRRGPQRWDAATIDHVVPRSRGGTHRRVNLVMACWKCNTEKGDKLIGEAG